MANQGGLDLPPDFRPGMALSASDLNKITSQLITRLTVGEGLELRSFGGRILLSLSGNVPRSQVVIRQFVVVSAEDDYLVCHYLDQDVEGTEAVNVAKEWLLRRTPFDGQTRNSISYAYTDSSTRTASKSGETDITEKITPSFQVGDVILGVRGSKGGIGVEDCEWFQVPDGRKWAEECDDVGPQGPQGAQGYQGTQGYRGVQGYQGAQGTQGYRGVQGYQGTQGTQGKQGAQGTQGNQGDQGDQGYQGTQGNQGDQGDQGHQGYQGVQGDKGIQGDPGGPQGYQGDQGDQGTQGTQGHQGDQGTQGNQGDQGTQGTQGHQGDQGYQGDQGDQGTPGESTGQILYFHHEESEDPAGYEGLYPVPSFSEEDDESVEVSSATGEVLIDSYITHTGYPGTEIIKAGFWIFSAYTYVNNSGGTTQLVFRVYKYSSLGVETELFNVTSVDIDNTSVALKEITYTQASDIVLDATDRLVIKVYGKTDSVAAKNVHFVYEGSVNTSHVKTTLYVTGVTGPQGAQGDQGDQGTQGAQGTQGHQGDQGTQGNQGHQGNQGNQGDQGDQGTQGTQGPQGDQGAQGADSIVPGPQGAQGATGVAGLTFSGTWLPNFTYYQRDTVYHEGSSYYCIAVSSYNETPSPESEVWAVLALEGAQGAQGDQGATGQDSAVPGPQGDQGAQGAQGDQGDQGYDGVQGDQGYQGGEGAQGPQGTQGPQGADSTVPGPQGDQGDQGTQGVQGTQGDAGTQGPQGDQGAQGEGGGGVTWVTKTTTYTAEAGDGILADTSGGAWTLTLPPTPTDGDEVQILDTKGTFRTYNLTLGRNGSKIQGVEADFVLDADDAAVRLIYSGATDGWKIFDLDVVGSSMGLPTASRGLIDGLILSNAADADHDITIAAGVARDSTDAYTMGLAAAITKQIDASWAAGNNAGGLDTGAVGNSTWYHVWLIRKDSDGSIDALFSTSATAPTMPAGYSYKRRIGSVLTNGSANLIAFYQSGNKFLWKASVFDVNAGAINNAALATTLTVPTGVMVWPFFCATVLKAAATPSMAVASPNVNDEDPNVIVSAGMVYTATAGGVGFTIRDQQNLQTNTSAQLRFFASAAGCSYYVRTYGWIDPRGRDA